jgi:hypothetical protein
VRRLTGLAIAVTIFSVMPAWAAEPELVLNDRRLDEHNSSASDGFLVWTTDTRAHLGRYNTYVRPDGGERVRINPVATESFAGAIDGTTIVYDEVRRDNSDLYFTDAVAPDRAPPPEGVNTRSSEGRPSLSGDFLLFTRTNANRVRFRDAWTRIILFDLDSRTSTVLRERPAATSYLVSDQVNGDWATFESCRFEEIGFTNCHVFRYQISTLELDRLDNPDRQQYAGGVSSDGTVYLVRTGTMESWHCGRHSTIVRVPLAGPEQAIATLPDGKDALTTFAFDEEGGGTTLYLDRLSCERNSRGIFRIPDADTAT